MAEDRTSEASMRDFVGLVAGLTKDGEDLDGEPFDLACDDAVDTLHRLIDMARGLIGDTGGS
jgi:hypothetical protein